MTVISNKIDSFGLERAESAGIPSRVFLRQDFTSNLDMDKAIGDYLEDLNVDLIVLAGYMKILTKPFYTTFCWENFKYSSFPSTKISWIRYLSKST